MKLVAKNSPIVFMFFKTSSEKMLFIIKMNTSKTKYVGWSFTKKAFVFWRASITVPPLQLIVFSGKSLSGRCKMRIKWKTLHFLSPYFSPFSLPYTFIGLFSSLPSSFSLTIGSLLFLLPFLSVLLLFYHKL